MPLFFFSFFSFFFCIQKGQEIFKSFIFKLISARLKKNLVFVCLNFYFRGLKPKINKLYIVFFFFFGPVQGVHLNPPPPGSKWSRPCSSLRTPNQTFLFFEETSVFTQQCEVIKKSSSVLRLSKNQQCFTYSVTNAIILFFFN